MSDNDNRRIPWARVSVEGLIIVVSVLLALAADAWWDGRQSRRQERAILSALREDFRSTLDRIASVRTEQARLDTVAERLIALGGPRPGEISVAGMDTLLAQVITWGAVLDPVDATLNALLSSDGLGAISDPDLRTMLAQSPVLIAALRRTDENSRNQMLTQFMPYLAERVPIRTLDAIGNPTTGGPPSAFARDARELLTDLRFQNHVNDILFYSRIESTRLATLHDHITATLDAISAQLPDS